MSEINLADLKEKIEQQHEGDARQLEVIFSEDSRLIVEAPAGYGKTTTMVSRIAYLFAAGKIPNPKKVLALTFSVNAALKIKRDIAEKLPDLMELPNNPEIVGSKVTATNYHGFCKMILKKYGHLLTPMLQKDVNLFKALGDGELEKRDETRFVLTQEEMNYCKTISDTITAGNSPTTDNRKKYLRIISGKLLPIEIITHNAVLLYTLELFSQKAEVKNFYQNYYPLLVVDEFQDTNPVAWELLKSLISDQSQLLFLGDSLQRIYGFIGALPNIMQVAEHSYNMRKISLDRNYRFRNNPEMLKLDANIRKNAALSFQDVPNDDPAKVPAAWGRTQDEEASLIAAKVEMILNQHPTGKVAILCRARGCNASKIEQALQREGIDYFYGMFTDEDSEYVDFHVKCQEAFLRRFGRSRVVNNRSLKKLAEEIRADYSINSRRTIGSLLELLDALLDKVAVDYATISPEDKFSLMSDIFENRQLKQAMEYVSAQVILTTVHGAKGLEWDYVFLPDVEQWVFPGFICNECANKFTKLKDHKYRCTYLPEENGLSVNTLAEELSVFYVGVTRARKQVFISASAKRINKYGQEKDTGFSCLANLNGIKLKNSWEVTL